MIDPGHPRLSIVRQCELASISRSSFYREPAPESYREIIAYLEAWEKTVDWSAVGNGPSAAPRLWYVTVDAGVDPTLIPPQAIRATHAARAPHRPTQREISERFFSSKLAEAQRHLDEMGRVLEALGRKLDAGKVDEPVEVEAEVDAIEALIWRYNDAIESALETWLRGERSRLSRSASVAKPIDYLLRRWDRFTPFLADGRICLTNNAAERALRGFALGRKSWLFAGSERGAARAAVMTTLITSAKLNDVDPLAWLADVLARIAGMPHSRLPELLPWEWKKINPKALAA